MATFGGPADWWTDGTDAGRKHIATKGIVQNGLVLNLDAGVSDSYPGSGNTWYDLSGNSNNATLLNTPTYSNLKGGSLNFDGVNEAGQVNSNSLINSSNITVDVWLRLDTPFINGQIVARDDSSNTGNYLISRVFQFRHASDSTLKTVLFNSNNSIILNINTSETFQTLVWYNVGLIVGNGTCVIYSNGNYLIDTTFSGTFNTTSTIPLYIATREESLTAPAHGEIPIVRYYNRALTQQEVQQNFDATRTRYGI